MYLNQLTQEQKRLFLDLCIHAAGVDSDFDEKEKLAIQAYSEEMKIALNSYNAEKSLDEDIDRINEISSPVAKRIISLELTALVMSDEVFNAFEQNFMHKINGKLGIPDSVYKQMISVIKDLSEVYSKMQDLLSVE